MDSYNFQRQYASFPKQNNPVRPEVHMVKVPFTLAKFPWSTEERILLFLLPTLKYRGDGHKCKCTLLNYMLRHSGFGQKTWDWWGHDSV